MMEAKQERFDPLGMVIKTEPGTVSDQKEDIRLSGKPHTFKCEDEMFKSREHEVLKLEPSELPTKFDLDSLCESASVFNTTIKKEFPDNNDVKIVDINNIKLEVSDYVQLKTESDLLTSHYDLPTLKDENTNHLDYIMIPSCNKKQSILKPLKNNKNVFKKKRSYPCLVCQKSFPSSNSRRTHIDGHFGQRSVVCEFCGKSLTKNDYLRHYFIHIVKKRARNICQNLIDVSCVESYSKIDDNNKFLNCDIRPKKIKHKYSIQRHLTLHSDKKPFENDIRDLTFVRNRHLLSQSNEKPLKFDMSLREYIHKSSLHRHLLTFTQPEKKPFTCDICFQEFSMKVNYESHLIRHTGEKPFKCDICLKEFDWKSKLQKHSIIHSNDNPNKCDICSKGFITNGHLKSHLSIHTNERPFKCDVCSKRYKDNSSLRNHIQIHTNEKAFKCDICSKGFTLKRYFKRHLLWHTNEKPFKCDICFKGCTRKSALQNHLLIHSNEKPVKCDICSRQFKQKSHLQSHLVSHSNVKPFKCDICSRKFKRKPHLHRHLLLVHTNENPSNEILVSMQLHRN